MNPFVSVKRIAFTIGVLIAATAAAVWLIMKGYYPYVLLPLTVIIYSVFRLFRIYTNSIRKAAFMFNAIEGGDYAFSFSEDERQVDDAFLNGALNRIKDILWNAKQQVIEHERYYELIMNSVNTGIITVNDHGNVYQVNSGALRVFKLPVLTHINQLNRVDPVIKDAVSDICVGEKAQVTFYHKGEEVSVSLMASEVMLEGQVLKIVAITDINSELAEKEIESWIRLTKVLTHEIMNSLSPITSLSDTLIKINGSKDDDMLLGLQTINATSKSLISFVESYRKFTFIPTPEKKLFAVKPFLEHVMVLHSQEWNASVGCSVSPEDIMVHADEDLIAQVVLNILKNSAYATASKEEPLIWICSYVDEKENVIIEVSNNGGAIPEGTAENIFVPFFTTKEKGSGIGLSISRQIMRLHGGSIRLASNTDEKVTITLLFP